MGLFEDIGRKVETFKQQAESVSEDQARAKCPECETLVYTDRDDCPECGHDSLLVRKDSVEGSDGDDAESETDDAGSETETDDAGDETNDGGADADSGDDEDADQS